jgi:hypothetical protein
MLIEHNATAADDLKLGQDAEITLAVLRSPASSSKPVKMARHRLEADGGVAKERPLVDSPADADFELSSDCDPLLVAIAIDMKLRNGRKPPPRFEDDPMQLLRGSGERVAVSGYQFSDWKTAGTTAAGGSCTR